MKISLWIPAMLLCYVVKIASPSCTQVGTVLFTATDLVKKCWSESDKALLTARLVMQDVLPDPECIDFSKDDAVVTLLEYFQSCYKIISVSTYGKLQNLMLLALSDAIGGYLRAYVLPLTRRAFYAGSVTYCDAKKLFQLYDDIKVFLKTNGVGWAKPKKLCGVQFKPIPLVLNKWGEASACNELYTIDKGSIGSAGSSCGSQDQPQPPNKLQNDILLDDEKIEKSEMENSLQFKKFAESIGNKQARLEAPKRESKLVQRKRKRRNYHARRKKKIKKVKKAIVSGNNDKKINKVQRLAENLVIKPSLQNYSAVNAKEKFKSKRDAENIGEKMSSKVVIPLPTLDDTREPYTIAVPFKIKPLRKVKDQASAFVLEHYYSSVIKCMLSKESSKRSIKNFNAAFNSWLNSQIVPLLENEEWYPAFGGVLRVQETIKKLGCRKSFKEKDLKNIGFMFPERVEVDDSRKNSGKDQVRDVENIPLDEKHGHNRYYIMYGLFTLGTVSVFAIGVLCTFCCTTRKPKSYSSGPSSSASTPSKTGKSKTLDFQFLIQFFKKQDDAKMQSQSRQESRYGNPYYQRKFNNDSLESLSSFVHRVGIENEIGENPILEATNSRKKTEISDKNLREKGGGDIPSLQPLNFEPQKQYIKSILSPFWPYRSPLFSYEKMEKRKSSPFEENLQQNLSANKPATKTEVETIWKKPNKRLKESSDAKGKTKNKSIGIPLPQPKDEAVNATESETISAEAGESRRRCSSCGYSETPNSQLISTNTSSQTQEALKMNSSALKFSEPAMRRRKTKSGNRSAKYYTGESYSEGEGSYSTESDSSETSLN